MVGLGVFGGVFVCFKMHRRGAKERMANFLLQFQSPTKYPDKRNTLNLYNLEKELFHSNPLILTRELYKLFNCPLSCYI